ncbi:MAG: histidinol-phosphatase [Dehalococcoidia bacterium]
MAGESYRDLMEAAVQFADEAGRITLKYFRGEFEVERKADTSFVTVADREAEARLRELIEARFPEDGIVGEEFGETRPAARRRWILDPIDGTFSFVHGVPLYGVLIGVEEDGEPVAGVINLAALDETVVAAKGEGCFWQGRRAQVSETAGLGEALLIVTEKYYAQPVPGDAIPRLIRAAGPVRTWGDCYGYALVATGRADVAVDPVMSVWDCGPLLTIIEEAGGRFSDWKGERTISGGNAVATNGKLHDAVLALLRGDG